MSSKKTDLDKFSEFFCGLGFSITTLQPFDSSYSSLTCKRKDQMLGFSFDRDGELVYSTGCKSSATAAETIDARLETLEADNARVTESIKRLSESGHITSSSGNAINVRNTPDAPSQSVEDCGIKDSKFEEAWALKAEKDRAAKAKFFSGGGEAIGSSHGGRVEFVSVSGDYQKMPNIEKPSGTNDIDITDEMLERMIQKVRALSPEDAMARLMSHKRPPSERSWSPEELPHTLPPHIMRMVKEASELEVKRDALQSYINGNDEHLPDDNRVNVRLRAEQVVAMSSYHGILKDRIANETLKHFGGES